MTDSLSSQAPTGEPGDDAPVEANVDLDVPAGLSRRRLFTSAAVGAGVLAAGGLAGWAVLRGRDEPQPAAAGGLTVTRSWAGQQLTLTTPSGACDAPLVAAYEKGFFTKAGLDVVLKKAGTDEDITAAVGSGKYVASNGIFFNYLGPIYNGTPVKLSGGLHLGCLDLYVRNDGSVASVAPLKGRRIGSATCRARPPTSSPSTCSPPARRCSRSRMRRSSWSPPRPPAAPTPEPSRCCSTTCRRTRWPAWSRCRSSPRRRRPRRTPPRRSWPGCSANWARTSSTSA
nr:MULTISPECIES: ABC transporter substrate-binding protein [unclassified Actinoplanes]